MKFEYDTKGQDKECVAYIDRQGDLVVKANKTYGKNFCISEADGFLYTDWKFKPEESQKQFYPGDSITITF